MLTRRELPSIGSSITAWAMNTENSVPPLLRIGVAVRAVKPIAVSRRRCERMHRPLLLLVFVNDFELRVDYVTITATLAYAWLFGAGTRTSFRSWLWTGLRACAR